MRNERLAFGGSIITRRQRRPRRSKRLIFAFMALGVAALGAAASMPKHPLLVWNASASAPLGLYRVMAPGMVNRGDWLLAWPPHAARQLAAARSYLPAGVPLIKPVAALPGDWVCATEATVRLGSGLVLDRLARDGQGRPLPAWQGCRQLSTDELFLANSAASDSFDSRYFGPVERASVIGRLVPLWVW